MFQPECCFSVHLVCVGCLCTLCLSVFPTNKSHTNSDLGITTQSLNTWFISFVEWLTVYTVAFLCMKFLYVFSSSISFWKDRININLTFCSEFIVSCKSTVLIILWAHWSHSTHLFSHHVMEPNEWGVYFLHSSSDCSGC
jgi:hypothetical protein